MKKVVFTLPAFLLFVFLSSCTNLGKEKTFNGVELYHTKNISQKLADSLGKYLVNERFADGSDKTVQITKSGDDYHLRMVIKQGIDKDTSLANTFKIFASSLSKQVFNNVPVVVELCDDQMTTLKSFTSDELGKAK